VSRRSNAHRVQAHLSRRGRSRTRPGAAASSFRRAHIMAPRFSTSMARAGVDEVARGFGGRAAPRRRPRPDPCRPRINAWRLRPRLEPGPARRGAGQAHTTRPSAVARDGSFRLVIRGSPAYRGPARFTRAHHAARRRSPAGDLGRIVRGPADASVSRTLVMQFPGCRTQARAVGKKGTGSTRPVRLVPTTRNGQRLDTPESASRASLEPLGTPLPKAAARNDVLLEGDDDLPAAGLSRSSCP